MYTVAFKYVASHELEVGLLGLNDREQVSGNGTNAITN